MIGVSLKSETEPVQTGSAAPESVLTDCFADKLRYFVIESSRTNSLAGITRRISDFRIRVEFERITVTGILSAETSRIVAVALSERPLETVGSVLVVGAGFAYTVNFKSFSKPLGKKSVKVRFGHLSDKLRPLLNVLLTRTTGGVVFNPD